jgi:hypothetical protein
MRFFASAVIVSVSAALIGRGAHSTAAGFTALVVLSVLFGLAVAVRSRRQEAEAS